MVWGLVRGLDGLLTNPRGTDSMHAASSAEKLNRHHGHEQQQQQQEWGSQLQQPAGTARTKKRWRRRDRQLVQQQPSYSMAKWLSLLTCYSEFQQQLWDGLLWQANCSTVSELWTTVAGSKAAAGAVGIQNKTTPIHEALLERPDEPLEPDLLAANISDINCLDTTQGWTALHHAAAAHNTGAVHQLLVLGADPAPIAATTGLTPLHLAVIGRLRPHDKVSKQEAEATLGSGAHDLVAYLQRVAKLPDSKAGSLEVVLLLLWAGAPANAGLPGITPLHLAAACCAQRKVEKLMHAASAAAVSMATDAVSEAAQLAVLPTLLWIASALVDLQDSSDNWDSSSDDSNSSCDGRKPVMEFRTSRPAVEDSNKGDVPGSEAVEAQSNGALQHRAENRTLPADVEQTAIIYCLLASGAHPDTAAAAIRGETPLTLAADAGSSVGVAALLQPPAGLPAADPNKPRTADSARPIDLAAVHGWGDVLLLLLENGANVMPPDGHAALATGAGDSSSSTSSTSMAGTAAAAPAAVGAGPGFSTSLPGNAAEWAPLQLLSNAVAAAPSYPVQVVQRILDQGFPLNVINEGSGGTALVNAILGGHTEVVNRLIAAGADVNIPVAHGKNAGTTPLYLAVALAEADSANALIEAGADISNCSKGRRYTVAQMAALTGSLELLLRLVEAGAEWRVPRGGSTAPQLAAERIPGMKAAQVEMRLKLAERKAKQQHSKSVTLAAGSAAAAGSGASASHAAVSPATAQLSSADDVDALIAALGLEQEPPARPTAAAVQGKVSSTKAKNERKARAKQQQQQQQPKEHKAIVTTGAHVETSAADSESHLQQSPDSQQPDSVLSVTQQQAHNTQQDTTAATSPGSPLSSIGQHMQHAPQVVQLDHEQQAAVAAGQQSGNDSSGNHSSIPGAAAVVPTIVLQKWRGSINPVLLYSRSATSTEQQNGSNSSTPSGVAPGNGVTACDAHKPDSSVSSNMDKGTMVTSCVDSDRKAAGVRKARCIACLESKSDVLILPCKHMVLCSRCCSALQSRGAMNECPWCRTVCVKWLKVHT